MFQAQVNAKVESYEPRIAVLEGTRSQEDTTNTTTQDAVVRLRQAMDSLQVSVCVFEQRNSYPEFGDDDSEDVTQVSGPGTTCPFP
jgi:hypothetical protein